MSGGFLIRAYRSDTDIDQHGTPLLGQLLTDAAREAMAKASPDDPAWVLPLRLLFAIAPDKRQALEAALAVQVRQVPVKPTA